MHVGQLADNVVGLAAGRPRFIVAIAGPPGAGKSTLAEQVRMAIAAKSVQAKVVPMDGFHLDNATLSNRGLLDRKGAPETFDAAGFVDLIKRAAPARIPVPYPTFDREKDAVIENSGTIAPGDAVLIVEGNYLLLKDAPWNALQEFWDHTVFLNPGIDILEKRLIDRWLDHGMDQEQARAKALLNDIPNANYVLQNSVQANTTIKE